uniref:Rieske domain-containing protein n=1 Tax=Paramormyrops kingsleyae TaxID=1676925 RepID=A0A3B3Q2Z5_9TELE
MSAEEKNEDPSPPSSYFIGKREDIVKVKRVTKFINGRDVLVLYHNGTFHAMDMRCYHSGGPLQNGDIEEFSGKLCIVCPWHKYKITLLEGEGLYQAVDPSQKVLKPKWASKGIKQRVHLQTQNTTPYDSKSRLPVDVVSVSHSKHVSAFSNFSTNLPASKPAPKAQPAAILEEGIIKAETRPRLGERDDTLPPNYRFPKEPVPVAPVLVENK